MCGRFARKGDLRALAKEFGVAEVPKVEVSYNIAPAQEIFAVRQGDDGREVALPYPAEEMAGYPVSTLVNSPGNRGAGLITEAPLNSA